MLGGLTSLLFAVPSVNALAAGLRRGPKFDDRFELAIDVEIAKQEEFRVHRPYVAVYIEDKDGKAVRTLSLWVQTQRRGPKWIPDLRRWYRGEHAQDLIATVSSPTRNAGKYTVIWDGKNDKGALVDQGKYTVLVEAAREHGTYQLIRQEISVGGKAFKQTLEGNVEIKGAALEFRKRK